MRLGGVLPPERVLPDARCRPSRSRRSTRRHFDDIVGYLATLPGALATGADQGSYGTLLVTFRNLNTSSGFEGTVQARTYSRVVESDPLKGNVGFATPASLFIEAAHATLVGTARDTREPARRRRARCRRTSESATATSTSRERSDNVDLTFYDAASGQQVGNTVAITGLRPGELREVSDIWTAAGIPLAIHTRHRLRGRQGRGRDDRGLHHDRRRQLEGLVFIELKCADAFCGT